MEWYYLDRSGKEFGPFGVEKMRAWFERGFFPIGSKLLVRTGGWTQHTPVHDIFPDGEPFVGPPIFSPFDQPPMAPQPTGALPPPYGYGPPPCPVQLGPPVACSYNPSPALPAAAAPPPLGPGVAPPPFNQPPPVGPPPAPGPGYGMPPPIYPMPPVGPGCGYGQPLPYGYPLPPGHMVFPALPHGYPPPPMGLGYAMYDRPLSRSRSPRPKGRGGRRRGAKGGIDGPDGRRFKPHHTTTVPKVTDRGAKFSSGDNPDNCPVTKPASNIQDGSQEATATCVQSNAMELCDFISRGDHRRCSSAPPSRNSTEAQLQQHFEIGCHDASSHQEGAQIAEEELSNHPPSFSKKRKQRPTKKTQSIPPPRKGYH